MTQKCPANLLSPNIKKRSISKSPKSGFTLVEIIVASVLLALISAGIFSIVLSSNKLINRSQRRHFANEIAQAALENLRSYLGADEWYNASSPIHYSSLGGSNVWSAWHNLSDNTDDFLNMYSQFGNTEFAAIYGGQWRYKIIDPSGGYEYRKVEVEVDWTEPTP